ncbi:MAG: hypothetical protein ACRBCK_08140 [Alphaproteobacteria bacterium]
MNFGIRDFFHDMADIFTGEHAPEDHTTYNSSQVGAGLMAVKQRLEAAPEVVLTTDALDTLFSQIELTHTMNKHDIADALTDIANITNLPASAMAKTVENTIEKGDFNENLMRSIRFGRLQEKYKELNFDDHTINLDDGNTPH